MWDLSATSQSTYQTTSDEQHGNSHVLKILRCPFTAPAAQMFQENICRAIEQNERALYKFSRRAEFLFLLAARLWPKIPSPAKLCEAARPSTEVEKPKPKKNSALNPMRKPSKDRVSFL